VLVHRLGGLAQRVLHRARVEVRDVVLDGQAARLRPKDAFGLVHGHLERDPALRLADVDGVGAAAEALGL
jgi:hypothetical protein